MAKRGRPVPLSVAKARLSELVRNVRRNGEGVVLTIDGEPAAQIVPIAEEPGILSTAEMATVRALMDAVARIPRPTAAFDAVHLVADGRR